MTLRAPQYPPKITRREREELLESLLIDEPELTFTPRSDPDPLIDFLARQAARECYAGGSQDDEATGEAHLLKPKGEVH